MNALAVVAVASAVTTTVVVVRRNPGEASYARDAPRQIDGWEKLAEVGHRTGPVGAAVTIVECGDFQCPACRQFAMQTRGELRAKFGDTLSFVFRHWPLSYHQVAGPAAEVAECAGRVGKFWEMHDLFSEQQDSLGVKPMSAFLEAAHVDTTGVYSECIRGGQGRAAIDRDTATIHALGGTGTPTILVNGRMFKGLPVQSWLEEVIREEIDRSN